MEIKSALTHSIIPPSLSRIAGKQGTGRREQGTGNREQGTGNREQGTGNREQRTEDREQRTENREQGTGNREQGTGNNRKRRRERQRHGTWIGTGNTPIHSPLYLPKTIKVYYRS